MIREATDLTDAEKAKIVSLEGEIARLRATIVPLQTAKKKLTEEIGKLNEQIKAKQNEIANIRQTEFDFESKGDDYVISKSNELLVLMGDFLTNQAESLLKDEVAKFWVVTKPTAHSEMEDICFETDVQGIMLQSKGGLKFEEIVAILKSQTEATKLAQSLLKK